MITVKRKNSDVDCGYSSNFTHQAIRKWLKESLGPSHYKTDCGDRQMIWQYRYLRGSTWLYSFEDPAHATMFMLKWPQ